MVKEIIICLSGKSCSDPAIFSMADRSQPTLPADAASVKIAERRSRRVQINWGSPSGLGFLFL
jgi:hypothetical protein